MCYNHLNSLNHDPIYGKSQDRYEVMMGITYGYKLEIQVVIKMYYGGSLHTRTGQIDDILQNVPIS